MASTVLDEEAAAPDAPPKRPAGGGLRRAVQVGLSIALVAGIAMYVKSNVADLSDVWAQIRAMSAIETAVLLAFAAWNLATYWIITVLATPGLTYRQAMVQTETTTAVANTVPAGGAIAVGLTYAMLGSWGFSRSRTSLAVVVTGIWNNFAKLGMPILALAVLAAEGETSGGRVAAAGAGLLGLFGAVAVFALVLHSQRWAARVGLTTERWMSGLRRLVHRDPVHGWDLALVKFRARVIGLVRTRWISLTFWTLVSHLSLFAVLLVTLRQVGVSQSDVSWGEVLALFAFARLLTAVPLTPGGLGIIELALISGLTAAGGPHAEVVASVLVYRVLTYMIPIPFGLATYVFWRRNRSWRDAAPPLDPRFTAESFDDYVPEVPERAGRRTLGERAAETRIEPWTWRTHIAYAVVGLCVLVASALVARSGEVGDIERRVFHWVNDWPQFLYWPMWVFQQFGNLVLAFLVVLAIAIVLRRRELAIAALAVVAMKLVLERVVKEYVHRQRPGTSIGDVIVRGTGVSVEGLSFVSGHAVLSTAVATVLMPVLPRRWHLVPWAFVVLNGLGRIYVGAHNPLDVVGGAGLGLCIGGVLNAFLAPRAQDA